MLETIAKVRNTAHEITVEVCKAIDLNDLDGVIDKTKALINLYREEFYTFTRDECIKAIRSILTHSEARDWPRARWSNDDGGNQLAKMSMHIFKSALLRVDDKDKKASLTNGVRGCICDLSEYLAKKSLFHEAEIFMEEVKLLPINKTLKREVASLVEKYRHLGAENLGSSSSYVIDISSDTVEFLSDRIWMYWRNYESVSCREIYKKGIGFFLDFAFFKLKGNKIPCPCTKCMNLVLLSREDVEAHLLGNGFVSSYHLLWDKHGESLSSGSQLSSEDPTLSQESTEECQKGNESSHGKSSSLDSDLLSSIPKHAESYHGAIVDGLTSSPTEIEPAGSYDGASDPFTSSSTQEIGPSTSLDTEDSAMLYVTGGMKFSIEVTEFKRTGNIYEGVVLEWGYTTKRSFIPFESGMNAELFFGILRDFSAKHSSILKLFGACEEKIRENRSFVVVEPVLPLLEFFERELKRFCEDKGKKRGELENIDKAEWTEFISPKLRRIFRDVNLGIIYLLSMGNSPCYIEDRIYVSNDGSHGKIVPRSEMKNLKRIEEDLGLLKHAILQVINLPWKGRENLVQMVGADSTILETVYRIPNELFDFLDRLNPINVVAEQRVFDHPFFWTMNERVVFMEKLRYCLKGGVDEDLFLRMLEDGEDWTVNVVDSVQAGLLHYSYDCVFKYNAGRYGEDMHSLVTFVIACLTHCIDYAGNAAPDFEKVEVLRGLMKIFPKLYTKVNGILLDWLVHSCSANLNADKCSTDQGTSTSLGSPLLVSMKLSSQDMMLARDELVME